MQELTFEQVSGGDAGLGDPNTYPGEGLPPP